MVFVYVMKSMHDNFFLVIERDRFHSTIYYTEKMLVNLIKLNITQEGRTTLNIVLLHRRIRSFLGGEVHFKLERT